MIEDEKDFKNANGDKKDPENANDRAISQKKLEANRANAQRSTGPKTEQGKKHSRRNPMKHGLLASVLLVEEAESFGVFRKLLHDLSEEIEPVGEGEWICVEELAYCRWEQRRLLQWEASIIREQNHLPTDVSGVLQGEALERALKVPSPETLDLLRRCQVSNLAHIRFLLDYLESLQRTRKGKHIS